MVEDILKETRKTNPKIERNQLKNYLEELSSLGTIIYFKQNNSTSDYVITDVKWLNKFFKQVISMENKNNFFVFWSDLWLLLRDNTFDNFFLFESGDKVMSFIKQLLIDFDILLPMINHQMISYSPLSSDQNDNYERNQKKECYIVPILLKPNKNQTEAIFYNKNENPKIQIENFPTNFNNFPSKMSLKYRFNFKPPGLFQRVMMRLRNMIDLKENQQNTIVSEIFGKIEKEIIWQFGYQSHFEHWKLFCLIEQTENKEKKKTKNSTPSTSTLSEREISTKSHLLKIILKSKKLDSKGSYHQSNIKEYHQFRIFFDKIFSAVKISVSNWFSSLSSMKEKRAENGWAYINSKQTELINLEEHKYLENNLVTCTKCNFQCKVILKDEDCKCGSNLFFLEDLVVISKIKNESAEGIIYKIYHTKNKKVCALKEKITFGDEEEKEKRSENRFQRENFILKKLFEYSKNNEQFNQQDSSSVSLFSPSVSSFSSSVSPSLFSPFIFSPIMEYYFSHSKYICFEWIEESVSLDILDFSQNRRIENMIYSV